VKSGNILLREGAGGAAIADIGVAGKLDHDGRVPAINNPTLYSPPEHSGGVLLGRDADLFGLGLVFRELIGGPFPYDAYTRSDVIARLARSRYPLRPPDMALPIWASRSLVRFYNKATARNPGNRFQSARDMSSTLAQVRVANWTNLNADQWRALSLRHPDVAVQVDLVAIRRGFRASIRKTTGRGWRRVLGDQDFDSRQSFASAGLFDQAAASL
jgi:serine/threonine protein kinase